MATPSHVNNAPTDRSFIPFLVITAAVCGALIMVVEVLGSRVLGPFYGVSLFVWTSLITVTLVALAAGYAVGGVLSDRRSSPDYLYGIILAAGILVLLIPIVKGAVLKMCVHLGLRLGSLASALLLFGPSLFLLGCVSPYIVRIAAREMASIGKTVGVFYAVSTAGSFVGTLLTGFVLIAYLGINRIFTVVGLLLVGTSIVYFFRFRKQWQVLTLLPLVLLVLVHPAPEVDKIMSNGTRVTKVFEQDSFYGNLKVVDYSYGPMHTRELIIDGLIQGGVDLNNRLPVYGYAYYMQYMPRALNPGGGNCLVIGLGAGLIPQWFEAQGVAVDVVDIDPAIPGIARKFFGFHVSGDVIISDARYFLERSKKRYDYIILDVFNGDTTPGHVLSVEAMRLIKMRLAPRGVFAINLAGSIRKHTFMTASVVKTVQDVFKSVDVYPNFEQENGEGWGNLSIMAYDFPAAAVTVRAGRDFPIHPMLRKTIEESFGKRFEFPPWTPAIQLRDDYNPIDFYDRWLKENIRKNILETTDWDILI